MTDIPCQFVAPRCQLTTKGYTVLRSMLDAGPATEAAILPLLRHKLSVATISFHDSIRPNVVTLDSRVTFAIDSGTAETRTITQNDSLGTLGAALPITTLRGLALLGMAQGESGELTLPDGRVEVLRVLSVAYQPEAARRRIA